MKFYCFEIDEAGSSNFKGGHFIFVIFSSVCVEEDIIDDLAAWKYVCDKGEANNFRASITNPTAMSPKRLITCQLTGVGSLLPPVYSEVWAKGNAKVIPRTPFSSLRDAAHGKHVVRKTNGVIKKKQVIIRISK
ncbi:hypothetical protein TNCV_2815641 [Trichonephila clavipes]|nr:hypothetical protein TNCV_2815641 [Trichonephila clavipes]